MKTLYFSAVFEELNTNYGADSQARLLQNTGILRPRSLHLIQSFLKSNKILIERLFLVISILQNFSKTFDACLLPVVYS